ncbi:MAG: hypothetical protein ACP5IG_04745 [Candidatus Micrarchaeia archaeon]
MAKARWEFTHSPLKNRFHAQDIANDLRLEAAIENDLTDVFFKDLAWRLDEQKKSETSGKNYNIFIRGEQGSGKSTIAQIIKCFTDKQFKRPSKVDDVCFSPQELFERLKVAKRFDTIINDEAKDFMTQIGSSRKREQIDFIEQTIRCQGINLISCGLRPQGQANYNYLLWAFDVDYSRNLNRAILYDSESQVNFYAPRGFVLFDRRMIPRDFIREYERKKMDFTNKVKEGRNRDIQAEFDELALQLCEKYDYFQAKNTGNISFITQAARRLFKDKAESETKEIAKAALFLRAQRNAAKNQGDNAIRDKGDGE